ncbi:MAG: phosphoribosylformylglycinamidine synthase I [Dehalococcoidales bacterium]|nr:phosphoribosylformylglycinamidine synthase I [Dehalococcoidales bacterium]
MSKAKTLVLRAPGTNCDMEAAFAFEKAGADVSMVHIGELIRREKKLADYRIMVLPGGFTYGDDLGSGKVIANEIVTKLGDDVKLFVENGGLIIGICNGFQILVKSGLLPDPSHLNKIQKTTLTNNDSGKFECRWVNLKVNPESNCIFTKGIAKMYLPVAHGEGKFVADAETLKAVDVAVYYADANDTPTMSYPDNPNGSLNCIAGICDSSGRIFGLMPHPERYVTGSQHPRWTDESFSEQGNGFKIFENAVDWVKRL